VRIFLDECVDWRLARELLGHEVKTARDMGWTTLKNGELLALVSRQFDAFVTVDQNLSFQQYLAAFAVAVFVLRAKTNRLRDLQALVPALLAALPSAVPGTAQIIG
jgi:hypothetical protein